MVNDAGNTKSEDNTSGAAAGVDNPSDQPPSDEQKAATQQDPNIIYVGEFEPFTKINNGMTTIRLPKAADQAETGVDEKTGETTYKGIPFYHKDAGTIVALFPTHYKLFKKKGK